MFLKSIFIFILTTQMAFATDLFFKSSKDQFISSQKMIEILPEKMHLILGEYHYTPIIQQAQAQMISDVVEAKSLERSFTVGWEFLNYTDKTHIHNHFELYKNGQVTGEQFLKILFSNSKNDQNLSYLPIIETVKKLSGDLIGLNLPRSLKRIVTQGGLDSLDPQYIPPHYEPGSASYLDRFKKTMGGHMGGSNLMKYFEAQCLTDSILADQIIMQAAYNLSFMVVGSFHSDYNDGTVTQLKRISDLPVITMKFIDATSLSSEDIRSLTTPDEKYGSLADYIIFLNTK